MATKQPTPKIRITTLLLYFISLNLASFVSTSELSAQITPGEWLLFEFTPAETILHVDKNAVSQRISDSIKTVRDAIAGLPRARYYHDDCFRLTRLGTVGDSAWHIRIEDSCRGTSDTLFVGAGTLTNGSVVLVAPSDSTIRFRYSQGRRVWVMRIDTVNVAGYPIRYDTSYVRAFAPDTLQFLTRPIHWDEIVGKPLATTYFYHEDASDLVGYEALRPVPADHPEHQHSLAVSSGPPTMLHQFATDSVATPTFIPGGKWTAHLYGRVDNAAGGSYLWVDVWHRNAAGTETLLFTMSTDDLTTSWARHELYHYGQQQVMNVGDRIVSRVYAYSTSVPSRTVYFAMEGDTLASHIHFPAIYEGEPSPTAGTDTTFLQLRDTPSTYAGNAGKHVIVDPGEASLAFVDPWPCDSTFVMLDDTPGDYTGQGGKLIAVKATEDGLEFVDAGVASRQIVGYGTYPDEAVNESADKVYLWGVNGVIISHLTSITGDTILYYWTLDWAWIKDSVLAWTGGGGTTFTGLTDTPSSYAGNAGKVVKVNPGENALIFDNDLTSIGGNPIPKTLDSTNYFVSDTAYFWEVREMKPRMAMFPSAGGDSLLTKNTVGWKEFEVYWPQVRNNITNGDLQFDIKSDSANGVAVLAFTAVGTSIRTSTTNPPYISDATLDWGYIWRPNLSGTTSGTTRSGGSSAGASTVTVISAPNSSVRADGYAPIYYVPALMRQSNSGTTAHFITLRVYYVAVVGSTSTWYVKIENC